MNMWSFLLQPVEHETRCLWHMAIVLNSEHRLPADGGAVSGARLDGSAVEGTVVSGAVVSECGKQTAYMVR